MNKEFDFNHIGKRMPYTTPDEFFDQLEDDIWKEMKNDFKNEEEGNAAAAEKPQVRRKSAKLHIFMRSAIAVAASIAVLFVIGMNFSKSGEASINDVDQAFSQLTTDDQTYLLNVYQEDVFINE